MLSVCMILISDQDVVCVYNFDTRPGVCMILYLTRMLSVCINFIPDQNVVCMYNFDM